MNTNVNVLSSPEAAARLGIKPATLRLYRMTGRGPAYFRLGSPNGKGRAMYTEASISEYLAERTFHSTAEEAARAGEAGR